MEENLRMSKQNQIEFRIISFAYLKALRYTNE